jgi:hypothetical protein
MRQVCGQERLHRYKLHQQMAAPKPSTSSGAGSILAGASYCLFRADLTVNRLSRPEIAPKRPSSNCRSRDAERAVVARGYGPILSGYRFACRNCCAEVLGDQLAIRPSDLCARRHDDVVLPPLTRTLRLGTLDSWAPGSIKKNVVTRSGPAQRRWIAVRRVHCRLSGSGHRLTVLLLLVNDTRFDQHQAHRVEELKVRS